MWRDEYVEFLQARDTDGLFRMGSTMSQGHAMLWQTCLWAITLFTHNPLAMKIFHGLIAAVFAFFLVFKSPFKWWQSGVLLLSYFLLFEYALISRCYAFGVLFFFLMAFEYSKKQRLTWTLGIFIFLEANTSVYGMMLSVVFIAWLFIVEMGFEPRLWKSRFLKIAPILVLATSGVFLSYLQIHPREDNTFPVAFVSWPFNLFRFNESMEQFLNAFFPISDFRYFHFWNTNILDGASGIFRWLLPLMAFLITTFPFLKKTKLLTLWLAGVFLVLFFQYYTGFYYARYYGHFFLWWLFCFWLHKAEEGPDTRQIFINEWALMVVMTAQAIGGILVYKADAVRVFSRGAEVAKFLKMKGYAESYMIGTVDFCLSPISAELDRKVYSMQHKKLCSYTKWDKERLNSTDSLDLIDALQSGPQADTMVFIATHPVPQFEYFQQMAEKGKMNRDFNFGPYHFYAMAYFKPGIETLEKYWLFKVYRSNLVVE